MTILEEKMLHVTWDSICSTIHKQLRGTLGEERTLSNPSKTHPQDTFKPQACNSKAIRFFTAVALCINLVLHLQVVS